MSDTPKKCGDCIYVLRTAEFLGICTHPYHGMGVSLFGSDAENCAQFKAREKCPQCHRPTGTHKLSCSCGPGKGMRFSMKDAP
jgi:hypothetical protein